MYILGQGVIGNDMRIQKNKRALCLKCSLIYMRAAQAPVFALPEAAWFNAAPRKVHLFSSLGHLKCIFENANAIKSKAKKLL